MDSFDLVNPLTSFKEHQDDTVPSLFAAESPVRISDSDHFPASFRREAVSLILKVESSNQLDPFIPYLAVDYMNRFISEQKIPQGKKPWIVGLVAISCISLASKMKNVDFSPYNLQVEELLIYDAQSINRMEILILTALKWRMRSITPFSFIYYFLSIIGSDNEDDGDDSCLIRAIQDRASSIIFKCVYGTEFLKFKPSIIAASALLHASKQLVPLRYSRLKARVSSSEYVNKGSLEKCLGVMQDTATKWYGLREDDDAVSCCTDVSVSVLDDTEDTMRQGSSVVSVSVLDNTEDTTRRGSSVMLAPDRDNVKRRKLNGFYDNRMVPLSQIQRC